MLTELQNDPDMLKTVYPTKTLFCGAVINKAIYSH